MLRIRNGLSFGVVNALYQCARSGQVQRFVSSLPSSYSDLNEGAFDGVAITRSPLLKSRAHAAPAARDTRAPAAAAAATPSEELHDVVFNPFTGSTVRETAPQIRALQAIGISAIDGELVVTNVDRLQGYRQHVVAPIAGATFPDEHLLPKKAREMLGAVMQSSTAQDVATRVTELMKALIARRVAHRLANAVVGELRPEDIRAPTVLTAGQKRVLDVAVRGGHLYIGGTAGTGKTDVLRAVRKVLMQRGLQVGTTATTGLAAANLGGITYHSLLNVSRVGEIRNKTALTRIDALIIDEVSMMDKASFEALDVALRTERMDQRPFGGVQMIVCGDFLQLEAIPNKNLGREHKMQLVFESQVFMDNFTKVMLTEQVRQADCPEFATGLRALRRGVWSDDLERLVRQVPSETIPDEDEMLLFCRKDDVARVNAEKMAKLVSPPVMYQPMQQPVTLAGKWTDSTLLIIAPEFNETEFVNAIFVSMVQRCPRVSRRDIVGYKYLSDGFVVRLRLPEDATEEDNANRRQRFAELMCNASLLSAKTAKPTPRSPPSDTLVPFEVESALSNSVNAHPVAQPSELKLGAKVMLRSNISETLVNGATGVIVDFVAASRDALPPSLKQMPWCAPLLDEYISHMQLQHGVDIPTLPVVKFQHETSVIPPFPIAVGGDVLTHYFELTAVNVPLVPAYATTTHKAQGLTLNCNVRVCFDRVWDCNHIVYVALSRVKRPEQLTVSGLNKAKIFVNPKAVAFDALVSPAAEVRLNDEDVGKAANWHMDSIKQVASAHASPNASPVAAAQAAAKTAAPSSANRRLDRTNVQADRSLRQRRIAAAAVLGGANKPAE